MPATPATVATQRPLQGISSMATRLLLAELASAHQQRGGAAVEWLSIGGVDAARRVAAGEAFDLVALAADAIDRLISSGQVLPGSRVDLVRSGVAVAVPAGAPLPDLRSEDAVRQAVLAAPTLGYSTGPSGVALAALFQRWGIAELVAPRIQQPPPGVPVGQWIAEGRIALGFQQRSELIHVAGLQIVGPLPAAIQIETVFSAGICCTAAQPEEARALIQFMASPAADPAKHRQGMAPA